LLCNGQTNLENKPEITDKLTQKNIHIKCQKNPRKQENDKRKKLYFKKKGTARCTRAERSLKNLP
jgi:hypothetical protein